MTADEHDPIASPPDQTDSADDPAVGAEPEAGHRREDEVSWLGCLWLVVVPGIIFGAVVVALNWLGC